MNQTRKLLTLFAMVAFVVIIFAVGYNQSPYTDLQIEFGRGRMWGLTPLGISLAILIVIYAGLFAILGDGGAFLKGCWIALWRRRRALKPLGFAFSECSLSQSR